MKKTFYILLVPFVLLTCVSAEEKRRAEERAKQESEGQKILKKAGLPESFWGDNDCKEHDNFTAGFGYRIITCKLAVDTKIRGITYEGGESVLFHANGQIYSGTLAIDTRIKGITYKGGDS